MSGYARAVLFANAPPEVYLRMVRNYVERQVQGKYPNAYLNKKHYGYDLVISENIYPLYVSLNQVKYFREQRMIYGLDKLIWTQIEDYGLWE